MEVLIALLKLLGGFAILLFGGELLVRGAVSSAVRLTLTPAVIGLTVIAAGTSAPELVTSVLAALKDSPNIALGNVVGSNIFNILAIIGIASLLKPNKVESSAVKIELPFLIGASVLLLIMSMDLKIQWYEGLIYIIALIGFLIFALYQARMKGETPLVEGSLEVTSHIWKDIAYLIGGLAALSAGANVALEGGIKLGELAGLGERVIGLTIISVGTGLPELATSAVAAYRGRNDIAVANVLGSNMFNTLLIVGVAAMIKPLKISSGFVWFDFPVMIGCTAILLPILYLGKGSIGRQAGAFLLVGYVAYVTYLLFNP